MAERPKSPIAGGDRAFFIRSTMGFVMGSRSQTSAAVHVRFAKSNFNA